jgi:nucleotide-binding universal stress UspA family protein
LRILATFDGTPYSEETLPTLIELAALPNVEFALLSVAHEPSVHAELRGEPRAYTSGQIYGAPGARFTPASPHYPETKDQAIQRSRGELEDYLLTLAARLPSGTLVRVEAHVSDHPARTIIERAREEHPDMIVMASHSREGLLRVFLGSTAEEVMRSGVAPVLVVHPVGRPERQD